MENKTALDIAGMNEQTEMVNYMKGQSFMDQVRVSDVIVFGLKS